MDGILLALCGLPIACILYVLLGIDIAPRYRFEYNEDIEAYEYVEGRRFVYTDRRTQPWFPISRRISVDKQRYTIRFEILFDKKRNYSLHMDKTENMLKGRIEDILSLIPEQSSYPEDKRTESPEEFVTRQMQELSRSLTGEGISFKDNIIRFRNGSSTSSLRMEWIGYSAA